MANPKVSVMLPFYDDGTADVREKFSEALSSILSQKLKDFEIVLVVSGMKEFAQAQSKRSGKIRLFFFEQERRDYRKIPLKEKAKGIVTAWNLCIENSKGEYLAFHAYDDISLPERLGEEVAYLDAHLDVGAVGSIMTMIDSQGKEIGVKGGFEGDAEIRRNMVRFNPVPAPSLMARAEIVRSAGAFRLDEIPEDYDLWVRMAKIAKFHTLQKPLVKYRVHDGGGASIYRFPLYFGSLRVKMRAAKLLGIGIGPKDIAVNALQFASLFIPNGIRRGALEDIRGSFLIGRQQKGDD